VTDNIKNPAWDIVRLNIQFKNSTVATGQARLTSTASDTSEVFATQFVLERSPIKS
jgi:hypothetical protein